MLRRRHGLTDLSGPASNPPHDICRTRAYHPAKQMQEQTCRIVGPEEPVGVKGPFSWG